MGWSLDSSFIELDTHGTGNWFLDDTHLLNVGGVSTRLLNYGNGVYHATDENFWKITYDGTADTWTVQDKQGNTYYFEYQSKYTYQTGSCGAENADIAEDVYRWSLSRVKNIFNQEIQYTYTTETKHVLFNRWVSSISQCQIINNVYPVTATYPSTIIYDKVRYRVRFYKAAPPTGPIINWHGIQMLRSISMKNTVCKVFISNRTAMQLQMGYSKPSFGIMILPTKAMRKATLSFRATNGQQAAKQPPSNQSVNMGCQAHRACPPLPLPMEITCI